jgi:hypothetical protein
MQGELSGYGFVSVLVSSSLNHSRIQDLGASTQNREWQGRAMVAGGHDRR